MDISIHGVKSIKTGKTRTETHDSKHGNGEQYYVRLLHIVELNHRGEERSHTLTLFSEIKGVLEDL